MGHAIENGLVYSYLRFSDPKQSAGGSTDRQLAYAAKWAAEHGLKLDTNLSLRDEGLSAYHQQHIKSGALGVFLRAVEDGRVPSGSVLIVEGLDRLSRAEPIQAQAQLAQIVNAGITVVTASDGKTYSRQRLKDNPMDLVYSLLVMIRAHEESDTKSKRVKASIRRLCEHWIDGTYKGRIRQGKDPHWVRELDEGWELVPERVAVIRRVLAMYQDGIGGLKIMESLEREGLQLLPGAVNNSQQVYRLIKQHALAGSKEVSVDGELFLLPDYYPAILTAEEWSELQRVAADSGRRRVKGELPHLITGLGITTCGYCARPMAGQNLATKPRLPDGRIRDGYRRLLCASAAAYGGGCPVPGSTSVAPVERAIMSYCSDIVNLQALYGTDRSEGPRKRVHAARQAVKELRDQLDKLTDAMLATASEGTPLVFARRARQLEADLEHAEKAAAQAERELANLARQDITGADARWAELAAGVEAQKVAPRLKARQLIADTFEKIVVYHHGLRPDPDSLQRDYHIDLLLVAKGGNTRMLRVDREGNWMAGEETSTIQSIHERK
ncbi:recombinase family protein [Comamonas terrigena]|uniref:Recombinase family protein n=1 Tax=Comamonas terrigena TaxID=32013 RepID=A0A2A7UXH0_COMTR|nr:recombinase family protein [Comamonas terrigena]PEH90049.1 recombinase family protein [Comamonas terrigena]BBL25336.1 integrase [Comamonas terrigena NBRC 13299]SUY71084.1 Resolvase, N terminal domain [Comamonas terrigena]